jgi:aminoglycoside/choline kinase family phosphotransferase
MADRADIEPEWRVRAYLHERGLERRLIRLTPLTPDASDRRYVRATLTGGQTVVLAVYPEAIEYDAMPFSGICSLLREMTVPVPAVLGHSDILGIVALEDLGDLTLQAHLERAQTGERERRYKEAIDLIVRLQQRGAQHSESGRVCYELAFDVEKLTWELDFFVQHFLEGYRGARLTPAERQALSEEWHAIAGELASEPRVLCHRDFHSRNLMLHAGQLHVIDFQDARLGPDTYDLASLLRDAYVDVTEEERASLVAYFLELADKGPIDRFVARFDLMSVQRNLKALGTFGYQATVRGNAAYVPYMTRTLAYARSPLRHYSRFARLRETLSTHVPELQ